MDWFKGKCRPETVDIHRSISQYMMFARKNPYTNPHDPSQYTGSHRLSHENIGSFQGKSMWSKSIQVKSPTFPSCFQDELRLGPTLPRDAAAEHLSLARSAVVNAAMAAQVRRSLEAWEAQRRWAKAGTMMGTVLWYRENHCLVDKSWENMVNICENQVPSGND